MSLLIAIPSQNADSLQSALNRIAGFDWELRRSVHTFTIDVSLPKNSISQQICEYCQANSIQNILVPLRVHCGERQLAEAGYSVINGPSVKQLIHGNGLQSRLRDLKLDWRSQVSDRLSQYALGFISSAHVDQWLGQFERLGNHRAVGEHLLQLIDVLPLPDVGESLSKDSDFYGSELVIGFTNDKWGKSWGTVSNLIRKKCAGASILPVAEAIENGAPPNVLRLVEDGLFSGTEMRAILDSLRGTRASNRAQKVRKLSDPSVLSRISAQVYFAAVCDFGEAMLRHYTTSRSLPNIQIGVSAAARKLRVLQPMEPQNGPVLDDHAFRAQLRSRVVPFAFQNDKGWKGADSMLRAKSFCETIGSQLWKSYIGKKGFDLEAWPDDRIKLCALGMEGLGLTFAFPHSVPKASLPVFWARGRVEAYSSSLEWIPLFPDADG